MALCEIGELDARRLRRAIEGLVKKTEQLHVDLPREVMYANVIAAARNLLDKAMDQLGQPKGVSLRDLEEARGKVRRIVVATLEKELGVPIAEGEF